MFSIFKPSLTAIVIAVVVLFSTPTLLATAADYSWDGEKTINAQILDYSPVRGYGNVREVTCDWFVLVQLQDSMHWWDDTPNGVSSPECKVVSSNVSFLIEDNYKVWMLCEWTIEVNDITGEISKPKCVISTLTWYQLKLFGSLVEKRAAEELPFNSFWPELGVREMKPLPVPDSWKC